MEPDNTILLFQDNTPIKNVSASRSVLFMIAVEMLPVHWYKLELEMIQQLPSLINNLINGIPCIIIFPRLVMCMYSAKDTVGVWASRCHSWSPVISPVQQTLWRMITLENKSSTGCSFCIFSLRNENAEIMKKIEVE